jgi:hypothetical protein
MKSLESNKDNPERVQTQMYVALQIAALFPMNRSCLSLLRNYRESKVETRCLERDFRNI